MSQPHSDFVETRPESKSLRESERSTTKPVSTLTQQSPSKPSHQPTKYRPFPTPLLMPIPPIVQSIWCKLCKKIHEDNTQSRALRTLEYDQTYEYHCCRCDTVSWHSPCPNKGCGHHKEACDHCQLVVVRVAKR